MSCFQKAGKSLDTIFYILKHNMKNYFPLLLLMLGECLMAAAKKVENPNSQNIYQVTKENTNPNSKLVD